MSRPSESLGRRSTWRLRTPIGQPPLRAAGLNRPTDAESAGDKPYLPDKLNPRIQLPRIQLVWQLIGPDPANRIQLVGRIHAIRRGGWRRRRRGSEAGGAQTAFRSSVGRAGRVGVVIGPIRVAGGRRLGRRADRCSPCESVADDRFGTVSARVSCRPLGSSTQTSKSAPQHPSNVLKRVVTFWP